jgi:hypothetical protein
MLARLVPCGVPNRGGNECREQRRVRSGRIMNAGEECADDPTIGGRSEPMRVQLGSREVGTLARRPFQETPGRCEGAPREPGRQLGGLARSRLRLIFVLHDRLISADSATAQRLTLEPLAILVLDAFGYYVLHRFAFHEWKPGRKTYLVYHKIRTPSAQDSVYIHPVETMLGVGLLMACTLIVGPVSVYSFGVCFFVYSVLNIFIHSAFDLPFSPFRWISSLSRNHDAHHRSMKGGYYASLTPLWDVVFGTTD